MKATLPKHNPENLVEIFDGGGFRFLTKDEAEILTLSPAFKTKAAADLMVQLRPEVFHRGRVQWVAVRMESLPLNAELTYRTKAKLTEPKAPPIEGENPFLDAALGDFVESWNFLAGYHHELMIDKGFWENRQRLRAYLSEAPDLMEIVENAMDCQLLSLITTEVSETVEALRHGNPPDDKIPAFVGTAAECSDVILRMMDLAHERRWPVAEALAAKIKMNKSREKMHGGKAF